MRRLACIVFVISLTSQLSATQATALSRAWRAHAGRVLQDVSADADAHGNVYVVGEIRSAFQTQIAFIAKFGPHGHLRWSRTVDPRRSDYSTGVAVEVGERGSIYWVGAVGSRNCERSEGWFLQRLGGGGKVRWTRTQGGWRRCRTWSRPTDLAVRDRVIAMSGFAYIRRFGRLDEQPDDGWVDGFSTSGHHLWRAPFEPGRGIPQRRRDGTTGIAIGGLGNVYAVGWASVPGTPERRSGTMVLQKLTRTGRLLWRRSMLRLSSSVIAFHVAVRANRMMVAGQYGGGYGLWLGRFTVGGAFVSKRTCGSVRYKRFASDVAIDSRTRTWVVGGYGYDNAFARRYSAQGRIDWTKIVRGPKYFMFMTGVDTLGHGVAISGSGSDQVEPYRGYVWRFA